MLRLWGSASKGGGVGEPYKGCPSLMLVLVVTNRLVKSPVCSHLHIGCYRSALRPGSVCVGLIPHEELNGINDQPGPGTGGGLAGAA